MGKLIDKTRGRIKQAVGALTGDAALKREGEREERKAKVEGAIEGVKDAVEDAKGAVKDAKDAVKDAVK